MLSCENWMSWQMKKHLRKYKLLYKCLYFYYSLSLRSMSLCLIIGIIIIMGIPGISVVTKKKKSTCQAGDIQPLGLEDPLKKEMATHSSILA